MAEHVQNAGDAAMQRDESSITINTLSREQRGGNTGIVLSWEADNHDIPTFVDQQPASSESTAPTLRDLSLSTLPDDTPPAQADHEPPFRSQVHPNSDKERRIRVSGRSSVDESNTISDSSAEPGISVIAAVGSAFPTHEGRIGARFDDEDVVVHGRDSTAEAAAPLDPNQTRDSDLASSIITTPSDSERVSTRFTRDCWAILGPQEWEWFVVRLDTGSDHNVISLDVPQRMGIEHLIEPNPGPTTSIAGINGAPARIIGVLPLNFSIPSENIDRARARFKVIPTNVYVDGMLGANFVDTHRLPGYRGNGEDSSRR